MNRDSIEDSVQSIELGEFHENRSVSRSNGIAKGFVPDDHELHDVQFRRPNIRQTVETSMVQAKKTFSEFRTFVEASPAMLFAYLAASTTFYRENPSSLRKELLSGITVAILQIPESVAFSFVAGVDPIVGLYSSVFLGFITGAIGGRPGMISGAAGALAVVAKDITSDSGPLKDLTDDQRLEHLFLTTVFVGLFQMAFGFFFLAKLVRLIPETSMIGFMNGLAIIIFLAQLTAFQTCDQAELFTDCSEDQQTYLSLAQGETWMVILIVFTTMIVVEFFPRVPRIGKAIPASLVGLITATIFEHAINRPLIGWDTRTVKETGPIDGGLPIFHIPNPGSSTDWNVVLSYAAMLAAIGLIESVMTLQAVDEIVNSPPSVYRSNQECIAQGVSNFVCGFFNAMGGDAMIGQSTINVMNGARGRLSAMSAGVFMLVIILVASPLIDLIPVSALTGVLFMVVINTFNWDTFKLIFRIPVGDAFSIILVTVLAVVTNLAIAVAVGVAWNALLNVWENGKVIECDTEIMIDESTGKEYKIYNIRGPLFFGSVKTFINFFTPMSDPDAVIIDFEQAMIADFSGVAAIKSISERFHSQKKEVILRHLNLPSETQIARTGTWMIDLPRVSKKERGNAEEMQRLTQEEEPSISLKDLNVFRVEEAPPSGDPRTLLRHLSQTGAFSIEDNETERKD